MIVFCEDCGEKNTISPTQFQNGRVVFKCQTCSYNNNYLIETGVPDSKNTALSLYSRALSLPAILGGFIYNTKTGVFKNDLQGLLGKNELSGLGIRLSQNLMECRSHMEDTSMMTFYVIGRTLVVKFIDPDSIMVVACKTNVAAASVEKLILEKDYDNS